jgi:hypothetical protein
MGSGMTWKVGIGSEKYRRDALRYLPVHTQFLGQAIPSTITAEGRPNCGTPGPGPYLKSLQSAVRLNL